MLCYQIAGVDQEPEHWWNTGKTQPQPHPVLSAISVFDADCGAVHLRGKTDVAFRPFGLDVPDGLSDACKRVKAVLDAEKAALGAARNAIFAAPPWSASTAVGKAMSTLSHSSDVTTLRRLRELDDAGLARLSRLVQDLAKDPATAAAEQRLKAGRLKHMAETVSV